MPGKVLLLDSLYVNTKGMQGFPISALVNIKAKGHNTQQIAAYYLLIDINVLDLYRPVIKHKRKAYVTLP